MLAISSRLKLAAHEHGLCIWHCDWQFKNKDPVLVEARLNYVSAALIGPGLEYPIWGRGKTADEAVEDALQQLEARKRAEGFTGALARLEAAMHDLTYGVRAANWKAFGYDDLDDDVPF